MLNDNTIARGLAFNATAIGLNRNLSISLTILTELVKMKVEIGYFMLFVAYSTFPSVHFPGSKK